VTDLDVGAVSRIEWLTVTDEAFERRLEQGQLTLPRSDVRQLGVPKDR